MTNVVQFKRRKEPHPADDLSFMEMRKPKSTGINYWKVEASGNYAADCEKGKMLAREYLAYIGQHPTVFNATLLGSIVDDMVKRAEDKRLDGVARGFLKGINGAAMITAAYAPDAVQLL